LVDHSTGALAADIDEVFPDGAFFGRERLEDFLVRAALGAVPVAETARRRSASVIEYVDAGLSDDATLLLIEYRGQDLRPSGQTADDPPTPSWKST
jgi:hypothetical protein